MPDWVPHRRFRVLQLTDGVYEQTIFEYGPQASIPTGMVSAATGIPQSGIGIGSSEIPDAAGPECGALNRLSGLHGSCP
jgi:hypothetical protein